MNNFFIHKLKLLLIHPPIMKIVKPYLVNAHLVFNCCEPIIPGYDVLVDTCISITFLLASACSTVQKTKHECSNE